jgi:hypothetical protein
MFLGMADNDFPDDLRAAQTRLHQAFAEHAALCRADSPGWTEQQKTDEARLRGECLDLSILVTTHPYWETVAREDMVAERMRLKQVTKPATAAVPDVVQAA